MKEQTWVNPKVDRSIWPAGEWDNEPFDKVQWVDDATGLACLANRHARNGNWCGYVGVGPDHPWHGKGYNDVSTEENEYGPNVHGGLTYADECEKGTSPLGICHMDEIPPGDKIYYAADDYDALQAQLVGWKERALNAEARLQVYASRATQASGSEKS